MKFICIGFDIRKHPWTNSFNVDDTGWDNNEEAYTNLIESFQLKENEYQLLEISPQEQLLKISEYIRQKEDCNLVAIEFPYDIVKLHDANYGFKTSLNKIDLSAFICRGFDVCDFGLFSVLHNRQWRNNSELFPESQLLEALEFTQFVNVFSRDHFPNLVAKVYSLK